jgi:hypothetical protein
MNTQQRIKIAESIQEEMGVGNVWTTNASDSENKAKVRLYIGKGFVQIETDGHANIDAVKRQNFDDVKDACEKLQIEARRW